MAELAERPTFFRSAEAEALQRAYDYALAYFEDPPLTAADRRSLALLVLSAARVRRRKGDGLSSTVDAHALAAEIIDLFLNLKLL